MISGTALNRFQRRNMRRLASGRDTLIQIMERTVSKESAVNGVLTKLGIPTDSTMVFGDDINDLGLFHMCGFPVAMANAIPELKGVAKFVTTTNYEDGVAMALERFILNGQRDELHK